MKKKQYEIECGRCGETRLEMLTGEEAQILIDGVGPVYQQCERCGRLTGWIRAASRETTRERRGTSAREAAPEYPTPHGQERLATRNERDEINEMLQPTER
jgi:hypothetical protein